MRLFHFLLRHRTILASVGALLLTVPAWAFDSTDSRATLKGLKGLGVVIEEISSEVEKDGLTRSQLQTDVELRLQRSGIRVIPVEGSECYLYVMVNLFKSNQLPVYAFSIRLQAIQAVTLSREPKTAFSQATTWSAGSIGLVDADNLRNVRSNVTDLVDQFITAYLEQNPKQ